MDLKNYILKNYTKRLKISLKDMQGYYKETRKGNPEIYTVYIKEEKGDTNYALTVLNAGKVGNERFMTRGHKHKNPLPEVYISIEGNAKLLIKKGKKKSLIKMNPGKSYLVPGDYAHRAVNTGKNKALFISVYSKKAGHIYKKELF